jgi:hypothetical protein
MNGLDLRYFETEFFDPNYNRTKPKATSLHK